MFKAYIRRILARHALVVGVLGAARRKMRDLRGRGGIFRDLEKSDHLPFDVDFYLRTNPDVASSGADPFQHYLRHGRHEGRLGAPPKIVYMGELAGLDRGRETVLVVTHEATLSGVPVLSLNIIKELKKRYNVIAMLLDSGTFVDNGLLTEVFRNTADVLVKPPSNGRSSVVAGLVIDQLVKDCAISFAIVNSIESRWVLQGLVRNFIPSVSLIHEFAAYTRPRGAFWEVAFWSSHTVFSAPVVLKNAIEEYPSIAASTFHVIPQGRCELPAPEISVSDVPDEEARVIKALRPKDGDDAIVVLGAGSVHLRKGVDLFLDCAARILRMFPEQNFRFVWIGPGYDPEQDAYSLFLADQTRRAGLQKHVVFLKETSSLEAAYRVADIMMISSRLDPLPNVAIDAMAHGKPVVCFADTTGIADLLTKHGLGNECVSPYLDTADMAAKIVAFMRSPSMRSSIGTKSSAIVRDDLDMANYVDHLVQLAESAKTRIEQERMDLREIMGSKLANPEFLLDFHQRNVSLEDAVRAYTRAWASGVSLRKPFPGFHPGIYRDMHGIAPDFEDPFAHYLRQGKPEGPWCNEVITNATKARPVPKGTRVGLHVHVFYPELFEEILEKLRPNEVRPDLFVSVPSEKIRREVQSLLVSYSGEVVDIIEVPNRGRDIGSFLTAFGSAIVGNYDFVGHLHTKKSLHCPDPGYIERWRQFLVENMLGGATRMADIILGRLAEDPSLGMVIPDDPGAGGWDQNKGYAEPLAKRMGIDVLPAHFLFPVGSMFWARVDALRPLFDLELDWDDYPEEPIHHDGTVLHAIERLFGVVASRGQYRMVTTNIPGITR